MRDGPLCRAGADRSPQAGDPSSPATAAWEGGFSSSSAPGLCVLAVCDVPWGVLPHVMSPGGCSPSPSYALLWDLSLEAPVSVWFSEGRRQGVGGKPRRQLRLNATGRTEYPRSSWPQSPGRLQPWSGGAWLSSCFHSWLGLGVSWGCSLEAPDFSFGPKSTSLQLIVVMPTGYGHCPFPHGLKAKSPI